jgi:heptosyltransferase-2
MRCTSGTPACSSTLWHPRWVAPGSRTHAGDRTSHRQPLRTRRSVAESTSPAGSPTGTGGYQRAYVLPNSIKSALIPFFADIPERIGFVGESRYGLINRRHTLNKALLPQMAERFAQLAEAPGHAAAQTATPATPALRQRATRRHAGALGIEMPEKLAVFCPGAEYGPAKRWPARHFATLANALADQGYAVWLLGSAKDRAIGDEIVDQPTGQPAAQPLRHHLADPGHRPAGRGVCRLQRFRPDARRRRPRPTADCPLWLVVARLHAAAVGRRASSASHLDCSPCFKRECPLGHLDCLNKLDPQRVLDACLTRSAPA